MHLESPSFGPRPSAPRAPCRNAPTRKIRNTSRTCNAVSSAVTLPPASPSRPRDVRDVAAAARMARAKRPGSAPVPRPPARRSAPADRTRATMTALAPAVAARMAKDDALLAAAAEAVFGSADLCAAVLLAYSPKSHLRAARLVLTTSMVCRSWRLSVNSARVWAALCHQRWPSTGALPLPPMVDYCRYFQSRALAQAEIDSWS